MYLFIFLLFRLVLRREIGAVGIADVMLLVLIADAASNGMSGEYRSITDGCILVATLAGWNYLFDWMSFHFPRVRRVLQPPPLAIVKDGKMQRRAMRQELLTAEELKSKLREQGIENLDGIKMAYIEETVKSAPYVVTRKNRIKFRASQKANGQSGKRCSDILISGIFRGLLVGLSQYKIVGIY